MEPTRNVNRGSRRHIDGLGHTFFEEHRLLIVICPVEDSYSVRLASNHIESEDAIKLVSIDAFFADKDAIWYTSQPFMLV